MGTGSRLWGSGIGQVVSLGVFPDRFQILRTADVPPMSLNGKYAQQLTTLNELRDAAGQLVFATRRLWRLLQLPEDGRAKGVNSGAIPVRGRFAAGRLLHDACHLALGIEVDGRASIGIIYFLHGKHSLHGGRL